MTLAGKIMNALDCRSNSTSPNFVLVFSKRNELAAVTFENIRRLRKRKKKNLRALATKDHYLVVIRSIVYENDRKIRITVVSASIGHRT